MEPSLSAFCHFYCFSLDSSSVSYLRNKMQTIKWINILIRIWTVLYSGRTNFHLLHATLLLTHICTGSFLITQHVADSSLMCHLLGVWDVFPRQVSPSHPSTALPHRLSFLPVSYVQVAFDVYFWPSRFGNYHSIKRHWKNVVKMSIFLCRSAFLKKWFWYHLLHNHYSVLVKNAEEWAGPPDYCPRI